MSAVKDEDPIEFEEDEEVFACKYCDFQAVDIDELDEHIITHDEAVLEDNNDEEQPEFVPVKEPPNKGKKKQVEFSVKPPRIKPSYFLNDTDDAVNKTIFVCPYCSLQTTKKSDMTQHLQEHTSPVEVPIYRCAECPYATRRKCDMPKHLLTHCKDGNVPMYQCPQCSYATKRKGDLPKHLLCHRKPDVDELFSCNLCSYSTKRKGDLKKHLMSHESDPYLGKDGSTYNCTECGYTSRRLNDLHKHAVLHCDRLVTGALKCTKCDYSTTTNIHFAKHVLSNCYSQEKNRPPKEQGRTQDYIVLEGEEFGLYELEKKSGGRRKRRRDESEEEEEEYEPQGKPNKNKVVVLTGYDDGDDSSAHST